MGASAGGIGDTPGANLEGVEREGRVGAQGSWAQGLSVGFHYGHRDSIEQHLWPGVVASQRALAQQVQDGREDISAAACGTLAKAADQTPGWAGALLPSLQHLARKTRGGSELYSPWLSLQPHTPGP